MFTGKFNAARFVEFLRTFLQRRRRPVMMILDRHPAHIAKVVARFIQEQSGRLEMFFLPGYAPDLNPDEFVWNHIKKKGVAKKPLARNESLRARVESDLLALQQNRPLVRSFFFAPSVSYIVD